MSILIFQHWPGGGPGRLGLTLRDCGFKLDVRFPHLPRDKGGDAVPSDLDNVHGLVILGGPQNVTDVAQYPWMQQELELLKKAHERQLPIIGICLGAQMIAHALGGEVQPRQKPAIGFYPMNLTVPGQTETLLAGIAWDSPQLYACGQEVTKLPPGATLLASSPNAKNSMFRVGLRTFASQPHFECDKPMVEVLFKASGPEMSAVGLTMNDAEKQTEQHYAAYARLSDRLCVNLANFMFPVRTRLSA